jgi:Anti-sigma-K factor rskA, C-terminal
MRCPRGFASRAQRQTRRCAPQRRGRASRGGRCHPSVGPPAGGARRHRALGVTVRGAVPMRRRPRAETDGQELAELAALADGSLAPERHAALEARIAASSELAERLAEQQRAVGLARRAAAEVEAPTPLRARIDAQRRAGRTRVPRRLVLAGAAATVAVLAAAALALVVVGSDTSGEHFEAALAATELAPGARGDATLYKTSSGWKVELDATGLPRLDGGRFYEAWLRNAAGVRVPIGTFNEGQDVTLWAGVSPKTFTTLTVTREQAGSDQPSSGEKVLVGKVDTG